MADGSQDAEILVRIQDNYVPFLKRLLQFFEKKNETSQKHEELKSIYNTFTSAPVSEQINVYNVNKKKLDKWHKMYEKNKKRGLENDSQEDSTTRPKRQATSKEASNQSGFLSIVSVRSVPEMATSQVSSTVGKEPVSSTVQIKEESVRASSVVTTNANLSANNSTSVSDQQVTTSEDGVPKFVCASCQFNTLNETEFAQHAKNDHKNELSLWCRQCWRCFSNIGALVAHIKEQSCQKEEMIYKCGVKDCTFEVSSGQTFVHHLRHCHKGSPFIFCVHCQKIFTLPHCLVLHMQNECPYKDRNRKTPGGAQPTNDASQPVPPPIRIAPSPAPSPAPSLKPAYASTAVAPAVTAKASPLTTVSSIQRETGRGRILMSTRGRGRGRGRGGRLRVYESSDSDDADDPSWMPDPNTSGQPVRRSARWAKKVNDARNPEFFANNEAEPRKKSISSAEIQEKNLLQCPVCDFMAAIKSVLEDHFIGIHKAPNKNACLACNVKFENVKFFLDHFENHEKPKPVEVITSEATPKIVPEVSKIVPEVPKIVPKATESVVSTSTVSAPSIVSVKPAVTTDEIASPVVTSASSVQSHEVLGIDGVELECVVENIVGGSENNVNRDKPLPHIPYQAAIHKKNQKDAKLKKFEDLKSPRDLLKLKEEPNLKCFFKCVLYNCTYCTNDAESFAFHVDTDHKGKRLHCGYCLTEYFSGSHLKEHMLKDHGKRRFQCSNCFYRAYSKAHVQIHIKNMHASESAKIHTCEPQPAAEDPIDTGDATKTWPFICAVGDCKFQTFVPQEFKRHNETIHRSVSVFICYYCKVDFISFKRLMDHYRLHGINTFQCTYCVHGSDTKDEILIHLCNVHADKPFKMHYRTAEENAPAGTIIQSIRVSADSTAEKRNENQVDQISVENVASPAVAEKGAKSTLRAAKVQKPDSNFQLKAIKQEKLNDSVEEDLYDQRHGKCFPKMVHRISTDFFCGIPFCDLQFNDLPTYINHLKKIHLALNFPCPHCPSFSEDSTSFKMHLLCHGPDLFACSKDDCDFYHWDSEKVDSHIKQHSEKTVTKLLVRESMDDENLDARNELAKIQAGSFEIASKSVNKQYECPFCEYKSSDCATMKNHIYVEMAYKRFLCSFCRLNYCSRREVQQHFTSMHPNAQIQCAIVHNSELEYIVKKFLSQDIRLKLESSYSCENCSKSFTGLKEWQHHLRLCLLDQYRPYDCNCCRRSFSDLRILKFHFDNRHSSNPISFSNMGSITVEEEISQKLQKSRLKLLKELLRDKLVENDSKNLLQNLKSKFYKCDTCAYKDNFRSNVENHIKAEHGGRQLKVVKVSEGYNLKQNLSQPKTSSENKPLAKKSLVVTISTDKRYRCNYCVKKTCNLQELQQHVECHHPIRDEIEYPYFYWPENQNFPPSDTELFDCGYCSISKANLHSLKKHSDMLHSEMSFKVKGYISRNTESSKNVICGYCYQRLSYSDLKKHSQAAHPSLPLKSINDFQNITLKRKMIFEDVSSPKKMKFEGPVLSCMHCGGIFTTQQQISEHSKRHHSRLPLKYDTLPQKIPKACDPRDFEFYQCEFCPFVSNKQHLDKHTATKHKMLVSCTYCGKRFDSATKLKEHHDAIHKGLRWTIDSSKTYSSNSSANEGISGNKRVYTTSSAEIQEPVLKCESHYGKSPEPVDLSTLNCCLRINEGHYAQVPLFYLFQRYNMNPIVQVKDCSKHKI